jgi:hypothetical protein
MGLVPEAARVGDSVAVHFGGQVLYILRRSADEKYGFRLVGEAYFHGMMDGEAVKMLEKGESTVEEIILE